MANKHPEWGKQIVNEILETVSSLSSAGPTTVWLAGSAAIKPKWSSDVDIWFLSGFPLSSSVLLVGLADQGWSLQMTLADSVPNFVEYPDTFVKQRCTFKAPGGIIVQCMWTTCPTIMDVLNQFDLSVHAHARNALGQTVSHPNATKPGEPIRFVKMDPTIPCTNRMAEVWERYAGMAGDGLNWTDYIPHVAPPPVVIEHVQTVVAEQAKKSVMQLMDEVFDEPAPSMNAALYEDGKGDLKPYTPFYKALYDDVVVGALPSKNLPDDADQADNV